MPLVDWGVPDAAVRAPDLSGTLALAAHRHFATYGKEVRAAAEVVDREVLPALAAWGLEPVEVLQALFCVRLEDWG